MKRRLFISIPLTTNAARSLRYQSDIIGAEVSEEDFRLTEPESWHITLAFLGDQDDEKMPAILSATEGVVEMLAEIDELRFTEITPMPSEADPDMIWLKGSEETSHVLGQVRDELVERLLAGGVQFRQDYKKYTAHITLARRLRRSAQAPKTEPFELVFTPEKIELMESHLSRGGSTYESLSAFTF